MNFFYWDYVIGMVLFTILLGFTMGSHGDTGRSFLEDLGQASGDSIGWVILGGVIFNASNILLSASISLAGMSVAFPLGVGIALVLGVIVNYLGIQPAILLLLFSGVALIVIAIICNGVASEKCKKGERKQEKQQKGNYHCINSRRTNVLILQVRSERYGCRKLQFTRYRNDDSLILQSLFFSIGVLLSNFVFNTLVMKYPFVGEKVSYSEYFKGNTKTHICGMLGGAIWGLGSAFSYIASGEAGPAVSYALGQGAPLIAAIWGVFIWKEFKGSTKSVNQLLALMFIFFLVGLGMIVVAGN